MWQKASGMVLLVAAMAAPAAGTDVPEPVGGVYTSTLLAVDGGGSLFCFDGDTIYGFSGGAFNPLVTGIAATAGAWVDPSAFSVRADGALAYVATGSTGRIVEVNLAAGTSRELSGARIGGYGNYGLAVDPIYGKIFVTDSMTQSVHLLDPTGDGALTLLDDFGSTAVFGGGIAVSPEGELTVPVPTASAWPAGDTCTLDVYRFSRDFLDDLAAGTVTTGAGAMIASDIETDGSGAVAADTDGNTYILSAAAIYRVDDLGAQSVLAGDPSRNVFDASSAGIGFMGLAYDATQNVLYYAYREDIADPWQLQTLAVPEPMTLSMLACGAAAMVLARRRRT